MSRSVDKIQMMQQLQEAIMAGHSLSPDLLSWYTGTLHRWRQSLRSHRPLSAEHPADRPRIMALLRQNPY